MADALTLLKRARTILESRGYQVQTIRIATQPFPEYTKGLTAQQVVAFFKEYDALAQKEKFAASIGPAMLNAGDSDAQADLLAEVLSNTKSLNASLVVAGDDGVNWKAVGAAARVMKKLEETEHSQGNFRFAAIAMVQPLTPFFPAAYHTGLRASIRDCAGICQCRGGGFQRRAGPRHGEAAAHGFAGGKRV